MSTSLGLWLAPFDNAYRWDQGQFIVFTQLAGGGWFPFEPAIALGESFFIRASQPTNWVQTFKVYGAVASAATSTSLPASRGAEPSPTSSPLTSSSTLGTVNFANGAMGVDALVTDATRGEPLQGAGWRAELWQVRGAGALSQVGQTADFATPMAGYFFGGLRTVPGTGPGDAVTLVVRVFNTNGTMQGLSNPVSVTLGGDKFPPTNLAGLQAWSVRPITTALTIRLEGIQVVVSWSKDLLGFALEATETLEPVNWMPLGQPAQVIGSQRTLNMPLSSSQTYFRLRSDL